MEMIDTHAHIYLDEFKEELPQLLQRASGQGVNKIIMPAIDSSTHEQMIAVNRIYPDQCPVMMGLHPCYVKENYEDELKIVGDYFSRQSFIAVGEIGLDFYWDTTFTKQQYDAFHRQVEMALHYNIPIAIHSRNATDECIEVVKEHQRGSLRGVFHCFSGDAIQAKKIIDLNFMLGIGGVVTFKNGGLDKVIAETGLDQVVVETDAPYLAPVPYRGKRNEPSYLSYVVEKLAMITGKSKEEVAAVTTANAKRLFGL